MLLRSRFLLPLLLLLVFPSFSQAEPSLEKIDLFEGGKDGFALFRIPGVVVTTKGTALVYCEARKNSGADWGEIEVHLRRSTDGGKTWEAARQIAHFGERLSVAEFKKGAKAEEQTVNNPVAIVDAKTGAVHFLYCLNYARCFYQRSDDDGVTFSKPVEITAAFEAFKSVCPWTVLATGPGHGIQLKKTGRLMVPVWLAYGTGGAHAPSMAATIYSDDHGKTWKAGDIAVPNEGEFKNPNETAAVELSDGRVMLNTRSVSSPNRRLVTISPDGATGWSVPRFEDALWDPVCMAGLTDIPGKPGTLLFSNPHSLKFDKDGKEIPASRGSRVNVSIKLSENDGADWIANRTLEEGSSAYSDLAVLPDGTVLCFYERDKRLTVARFNLDWVRAGAKAP
ncbi:MAG: exo-alpha-sialidase [Verrucomicrobiae bacterium]|nr:exo-alpha-sialidase [Verrucomicrobiae bacterium]